MAKLSQYKYVHIAKYMGNKMPRLVMCIMWLGCVAMLFMAGCSLFNKQGNSNLTLRNYRNRQGNANTNGQVKKTSVANKPSVTVARDYRKPKVQVYYIYDPSNAYANNQGYVPVVPSGSVNARNYDAAHGSANNHTATAGIGNLTGYDNTNTSTATGPHNKTVNKVAGIAGQVNVNHQANITGQTGGNSQVSGLAGLSGTAKYNNSAKSLGGNVSQGNVVPNPVAGHGQSLATASNTKQTNSVMPALPPRVTNVTVTAQPVQPKGSSVAITPGKPGTKAVDIGRRANSNIMSVTAAAGTSAADTVGVAGPTVNIKKVTGAEGTKNITNGTSVPAGAVVPTGTTLHSGSVMPASSVINDNGRGNLVTNTSSASGQGSLVSRSANSGLGTVPGFPAPRSAQVNMASTIRFMETYVETHPSDVKAQLALRLLYACNGDEDKALPLTSVAAGDSTADNSKQSQLLAQAFVLAARANANKTQDDPVIADRALQALNAVRDSIALRADPVISCLKLCHKVDGFGLYEPVTQKELASGSLQSVIVYAELQNFRSKLNADGKYVTNLHIDIKLYDSSYNVIKELKGDVPDTPSYNKRHDFFLRTTPGAFTLPHLAPGKYEIAVTVTDKIAGRVARIKRLTFEVKK